MNRLDGQVAIITGASSGIGRATALLFATHGAKLVLGARGVKRLRDVTSEIEDAGGQAIAISGDVADEAYAQELVRAAEAEFGRLDIAFNNAGSLGAMGPTPEVSVEDWDAAIRVNLSSAFFAAKYQLPAMLKQTRSSLIFTSTFVGHTAAFAGMASYAASKAGLIGLVQALAVEFGEQNVRVNALLPGGTDTPMGATVAGTPEARAHISGLHALKRIAQPEEIAQSVLYLASDASSFTTGTALLVDGGVSVARA